MIVKSSVMDILVMGMPPQVAVYQLYLEGIPLFRQLISHQTFIICLPPDRAQSYLFILVHYTKPKPRFFNEIHLACPSTK